LPQINRICVYCGSSPGIDPAFLEAAVHLGTTLAANNIGLVYGGASIGLMGAVADATLRHGGDVHGVMPRSLANKEISHPSLTELIITESMHERKTAMADLADGFIALPGGLGTFEELFEIWTWAQLGFHQKPIGVLNSQKFFDPLLAFLDQSSSAGFVKPAHREMLLVSSDPDDLITRFAAYQPPSASKLS
jgi:uncharacterized protein (TIGR00730 family)